VFVSGLREYLGDVAGTLKVTALAKWKTTMQMIAIAVLFSQGIFEHYLTMSTWGMDELLISEMLNGDVEDTQGLGWKLAGMEWAGWIGMTLLWVAATLTAITGWDYFRKAVPHLKES